MSFLEIQDPDNITKVNVLDDIAITCTGSNEAVMNYEAYEIGDHVLIHDYRGDDTVVRVGKVSTFINDNTQLK